MIYFFGFIYLLIGVGAAFTSRDYLFETILAKNGKVTKFERRVLPVLLCLLWPVFVGIRIASED